MGRGPHPSLVKLQPISVKREARGFCILQSEQEAERVKGSARARGKGEEKEKIGMANKLISQMGLPQSIANIFAARNILTAKVPHPSHFGS